MFGTFNLSLMTMLDRLPREGLPQDDRAHLHADRMFAQGREAAFFLRHLADHPGLSRDYPARVRILFEENDWAREKSTGQQVRRIDTGDALRTSAVPNALVACIPALAGGDLWQKLDVKAIPPGFVPEIITRTRSTGLFEIPPVSRTLNWTPFAVLFDPSDPAKEQTEASAEERGRVTVATVRASLATSWQRSYVTSMARVNSLTAVGYGFERLVPTIPMHGFSAAVFRDDRYLLCENENLVCLFAPSDATGVKLFNATGMVLLNSEATRERYQGTGIALDDPFFHPFVSQQTAHDVHALNSYRLALLRENHIAEESLERLHGRAGDLKADAAALADESVEQYHGTLEASAAFSRRTYRPLVAVMNDLVTAVVFLLLLTIPFAFALERLLVGTPHIFRRVGWFAVFFVTTFGILYLVNPAFKLAATPIIIFLAFSVILLSALVIFIMARKLRTEMRRLQGLSVSAHTVDVSRLSTMSAAINMGISTMRRRPLRTLLTAVTVVLLTFTILTFASFSSVWGNRRTYLGPLSEPCAHILVRHAFWNRLSPDVFGTLQAYLRGRATVVPRYWLGPLPGDVGRASRNRQSLDLLLASENLERIVPVSAAIGLDLRDVERQSTLRACLGSEAQRDRLTSDGIFLTEAVVRTLGLGSADVGKTPVRFCGEAFIFAGTLTDAFAMQTHMDGSSILPVDYTTSAGGAEQVEAFSEAIGQLIALPEGEAASFVPYSADSVVVIPSHRARRLGATIRAVSIYPDREEDLDAIGEDVAIITGQPTYVGGKDGVFRLFFMKLIEASGFRDLIIPVVLGGLIIFATMLGSVVDREREIYTFSSLGLAPAHVAMLFFAEASIYAVVGGMGGYLLGQTAAKLFAWLGRIGNFHVPAMNFSSMNAIATLFIVMGVVLLSTLYPALKAARSANPGIQRAWRLPPPVGDVYDIRFPFTVSEYDWSGIVSYLKEYFDGFTDASVGSFATLHCHIFRQKENEMLGFNARVALAPFDLGLEHNAVILSQPSDVQGIDEIRVLLRRLSGSYGDWQRATRVFIHELRRQFLIWRTLDERVARQYREQTLQGWETLPVESRAVILSEYGAGESDSRQGESA